jgi:hypothetical protein
MVNGTAWLIWIVLIEELSLTRLFSRSLRSSRFTILLSEGYPQTRNTMALVGVLPREELFLSELITEQSFLYCDLVVAYCSNYRGFATGHPSRGILGE